MDWILEGRKVAGFYLNEYFFTGTVVESRVKYGGAVSNTIVLDEPIEVFGEARERVLMDSENLKLL
jgi:hypothetical protein